MKELIQKIKQKGYWKVIIRPTEFKQKNISGLDECKKIIEASVVSLRGWNYPHIDKNGITISGNDSIESYCDSDFIGHLEYWRFYQSGQFIHYFSMREDYCIDEKEMQRIKYQGDIESSKLLSIISTLYSVTEIFEFAQRLAVKDILGSLIEISIELADVEGRELFFWDSFSRYLNRNYTCTFRDENIAEKRIVPKEELIANSDKIALTVYMEILKKFNWPEIPQQVFEKDQAKFLQRRI